ncbi:carbohydrate sulfotransferase 12-like isoform X2 [Antennarius striatus]
MCNSDKEAFSEGKGSVEDMTSNDLGRFTVDDEHRFIYCHIPMVVNTDWISLLHKNSNLRLLNSLPRVQMLEKLKQYTKILFVGDPFVRLISVYQEKFQKHDAYYYQNYGQHILRLYDNQSSPPQTVEEASAAGVLPSFYNFIQYLIDPQTKKPFDTQWRQMYQLCHPCLIQYDFIGHLETIQEDMDHLLRLLKLYNNIEFPADGDMTSEYVSDWFKLVPTEEKRKLYNLYKKDFKLFGFLKPLDLINY